MLMRVNLPVADVVKTTSATSVATQSADLQSTWDRIGCVEIFLDFLGSILPLRGALPRWRPCLLNLCATH